MQVYFLIGPGSAPTDIRHIDGAFRNFQDIKPSLLISYSSYTDVKIFTTPRAVGGPTIQVEYNDGARKVDEFTVHRVSVWDSPTHL